MYPSPMNDEMKISLSSTEYFMGFPRTHSIIKPTSGVLVGLCDTYSVVILIWVLLSDLPLCNGDNSISDNELITHSECETFLV